MPLLVNSLVEWTDPEGIPTVERILSIDNDGLMTHVIRIDKPDALPRPRNMPEIQSALADGRAKVLTVDPYAYLQQPEATIPENHRQRRQAAWSIIEPIVTAANGQAFDRDGRGRLIREAVQRSGSTKRQIYRYLRRYWQSGMTPNALLPYFHLCGARSKERSPGSKKRGRPRTLTQSMNAPPGINVDAESREKITKGFRMFYEKHPANGGQSLRKAYELTLQKFFHRGFEFRNRILVPVLPAEDQLPTYKQFVYWARKNADPKETLVRRLGKRVFNLRARPVLGDSTLMAFGPGTLYQIDATVADDWIVSALDRSRRLGRPVVYLVVCPFSRLIAGVHVGLENPSFFAAGLALENATMDKVAYCAQFGIQISADEWPSHGLPESILADRGELEGYGASNLVQSLGIRVCNTSPYRADLKGIVERCFRSMNDLLIHSLPGATRKPKERGERDPRLDAVLTLHEFRVLMIHSILQHNSRRVEGYRLQKEMIGDHVEPRPTHLWAWGITNRSGHLRMSDPEVVRSNLLPGDKATVTFRGIQFRGLFYSCDRAVQDRWYEKARASRSWQVQVTYDPRSVDTIFLRLPGIALLESCQLLEADHRFRGLSWADVDDFFLSQKEARMTSATTDLQTRANYQAQIQAVVSNAVEQAAIANQGLTKSSRLRNVQENRQQERRLDSTAARIGGQGDSDGLNPNGDVAASQRPEDPPEVDYVPPPMPLEMLRKQRGVTWKDHE